MSDATGFDQWAKGDHRWPFGRASDAATDREKAATPPIRPEKPHLDRRAGVRPLIDRCITWRGPRRLKSEQASE